jgi:hypothetical protein
MLETNLMRPFGLTAPELQELTGGWLVTAAFFVALIFV